MLLSFLFASLTLTPKSDGFLIESFTYAGAGERVVVEATHHPSRWWNIAEVRKGEEYRFSHLFRNNYIRFAAFDAKGREVDVSAEDVKLCKREYGFMRHYGKETWEEKLKRVASWQHDRFGMFIHFGLYSLPARHEWCQSREMIAAESYQRYFDNFNPDRLDARKWAKAAKRAGMRYAVITTKHHDGFCLWDSAYTDFKSTKTRFGRDIVREFTDAFRAEGLKVGFYYSLLDWHHPDYTIDQQHPLRPSKDFDWSKASRKDVDRMNAGRDMSRYRKYMKDQIKELLTNYGRIDVLWYDFTSEGRYYGQGKSRHDWDSEGLLALTRKLQPHVIVNNRLGISDWEDGWDFLTREQKRDDQLPTWGGRAWPWESCQTFSGSWGYYRDEHSWKSRFQILEQLIQTVSQSGNLIMNIGPTGAGEIDSRAMERLNDYGEWMAVNSASIYGCGRASDELLKNRIPNTLYTWNPKTKKLYVHFLAWVYGRIFVPFAERVKYAQLLNDRSEVEVDGEGYLILPLEKPPVEIPVVEFSL